MKDAVAADALEIAAEPAQHLRPDIQFLALEVMTLWRVSGPAKINLPWRINLGENIQNLGGGKQIVIPRLDYEYRRPRLARRIARETSCVFHAGKSHASCGGSGAEIDLVTRRCRSSTVPAALNAPSSMRV